MAYVKDTKVLFMVNEQYQLSQDKTHKKATCLKVWTNSHANKFGLFLVDGTQVELKIYLDEMDEKLKVESAVRMVTDELLGTDNKKISMALYADLKA